jgi:hypothetical protein
MKKFTEVFTAMVTVIGLIFIGFTIGMNKDLLVKWYNYGCSMVATKNTTDLDNEITEEIETVVHSYGKKIEENHWRTTSDGYGYTDSNGVYHGTSAAISLHLIANPEEEITWVNDETGWTGTSTYYGNLIRGYRYTTGLRQL